MQVWHTKAKFSYIRMKYMIQFIDFNSCKAPLKLAASRISKGKILLVVYNVDMLKGGQRFSRVNERFHSPTFLQLGQSCNTKNHSKTIKPRVASVTMI